MAAEKVKNAEQDQDQGAGPEPFMQGTFALYETPDGGMVLTYYSELTGEQRQVIPPFLVKQGRALMAKKGGMFGRGEKS